MKALALNFMPSPTSHQLLYQEDYLSIYYNFTDRWVYADWTGYITTKEIKAGAELLLKAIQETQSYKLINDNTHLLGMKANAVEWLAREFAPRLQAAGLQYLAWIYKTFSLTEASADSVLGLTETDILVIVFDNVEMAEKWLRNVH